MRPPLTSLDIPICSIYGQWLEQGIPLLSDRPDTDWAWLAGIIEGEANISVNNDFSGGGVASTCLRVSNCDMLMLERCCEITGMGRIYQRKRKINPERHRDCHYWEVRDRKAAMVLGMVFPFLITKRRQARNLITLVIHKARRNHRPFKRLTEKDRRYRLRLVGETVDLNRRGNWRPNLP